MAPWQPSPEDISAALALLGGSAAEDFDGNRDATRIKATAERIKDLKTVPLGEMRDQLRAAVAALHSAVVAVKGIHGIHETDHENDRLILAMEERKQQYEDEASAMLVPRSGGEQEAAIKMRLAAWEAHDLLSEHGIGSALTRGGPYFELTKLLYKIATGGERDPARACAAVIEELGERRPRA